MTRRFSTLATLLLVPTLGLSSGCEFLDSLTESSAIVDVFTTSHGTPDEQGQVPERNGEQLIFTNDMGWEIYLNAAYVTTSGLTLVACDGERFEVDLYWGAMAENIPEHGDYEALGIGGVRATSGSYCSMLVQYAPFDGDDMDEPAALGSTVYLAGTAIQGDQMVEFAWRSEVELEVDVDLAEIDGGNPFEIGKNEYVSKKLTVAKAYDSFFAGIDFAEPLAQADVDALVTATLESETAAFEGTAKPN